MGYAISPPTVGGSYWVGVLHPTSHEFDFHNFTAICKKSTVVHRRADWGPIVDMLKKSKKRLINWFLGFPLPTDGLFPRARHGYRNIVTMFFNPDPEKRLRLISLSGK